MKIQLLLFFKSLLKFCSLSTLIFLTISNNAFGDCAITSQPEDVTVCGEKTHPDIYFSVLAEGTDLSYQWQINTGSGFENIHESSPDYTNSNTSILNLNGFIDKEMNKYQFRCKISSSECETFYTNTVRLQVKSANNDFWASMPGSYEMVCAYNTASLQVGTNNPTGVNYQWMENRGAGFVNLSNSSQYSGVNTNKLTVNNISPEMADYTYQVVIDNQCATPIIEGPAFFSVYRVNFTQQPISKTICEGTGTTLSVTANTPNLGTTIGSYKWQINEGAGFSNIQDNDLYEGSSTSILKISSKVTADLNGFQYRCIVTHSSCSTGMSSDTATLTVNIPATIVTQPNDVLIWNSGNTTLTTASSNSNSSYTWQYKTSSNSPFINITHGTNYVNSSSSTLTIQNATLDMNGYIYRCIIKTDDCIGIEVITNEVTLTVIYSNICMATIDETSGKNLIVFEKNYNTASIDSFRIYRETAVVNVYEQIGRVSINDLSTFEDVNSDPTQQPYLYKIAVNDINDVTSSLSAAHKTMHLTINKGTGNTWNLLWNAYEGITVNTYNIYRGLAPESMSLINSVSGNITSYTDNNAPSASNIYYQIEIVPANTCNPTAKVSAFASIKSNKAETLKVSNLFSSTASSKLEIYPNPANDLVTVKDLPENSVISIYDLNGIQRNMEAKNSTIDVSMFTNGLYIIEVKNDKAIYRMPLTIK